MFFTRIFSTDPIDFEYLESPKISKENAARDIMEADGVTDGLICVFTAVEPCISYDIFRIKAYNKAGTILRVETTINDPTGFKVFRPKQDGDGRERHYLDMRRGVADLKRRADVSQAANERYIDAIAALDPQTPMKDLVRQLLKPARIKGSRVRALNPWSNEDLSLLTAVIRGEFTINGFRNRDVRTLLYPGSSNDDADRRRKSSKVSRLLRILRAHGLIKKVPRTHRYQVSVRGRMIIPAIIAAHNASADQLTKLAA